MVDGSAGSITEEASEEMEEMGVLIEEACDSSELKVVSVGVALEGSICDSCVAWVPVREVEDSGARTDELCGRIELVSARDVA